MKPFPRRARWLLAALALAGCAAPADELVRLDPPEGTEWAECPPAASRPIAVAFRANATDESHGNGPGLYRLSEREFLWVWARYVETLREDRVTRVNPVQVARDVEGTVHVCTRVDVATPLEVDNERGTYNVAVLLTAGEPLPEGPLRVVVNWVAGCRCDPLPRGNTSASFD